MKIGILTHHYINNFGAFLQAYALQEAVRELFPGTEVFIIDYIDIKHFVINSGGWFRVKKAEDLAGWLQKTRLPATFARQRKAHMRLTKPCFCARGIEALGLDLILVGSDEVWNYQEKKGDAKVKFGAGLHKARLVAYAPSVGQAHGGPVPAYVRDGIQKFAAVSARDAWTQQLAETIRKEPVARVLDPTFLAHIPVEPVAAVKKPYLLFYYCDGLPETEKEKIFAYARKKGMAVYGAGECDRRYAAATVDLSPFQWAWMFRNAQAVLTGTFHGVVFSLLNHRRFACHATHPGRIAKVTSLLAEYRLEAHHCAARADELVAAIETEIDYQRVDLLLEAARKKSRQFLKSALENRT